MCQRRCLPGRMNERTGWSSRTRTRSPAGGLRGCRLGSKSASPGRNCLREQRTPMLTREGSKHICNQEKSGGEAAGGSCGCAPLQRRVCVCEPTHYRRTKIKSKYSLERSPILCENGNASAGAPFSQIKAQCTHHPINRWCRSKTLRRV